MINTKARAYVGISFKIIYLLLGLCVLLVILGHFMEINLSAFLKTSLAVMLALFISNLVIIILFRHKP